ncbi:MAG: phosphate acyltransferase PlsX [Atopobiaceae bacterium]|nr:phosphate acyltransferase PlsX [Atopobiaceae bacterium]
MTTICVDAMGGDEKPEVVCEGIAQALAKDEDLSVLVAGDESVVVPFCDATDRAMPLVTTEVIGMGEHPAEAVRKKKDSSIVRGCAAVRAGDAQGFFSAGSTGAIFAAATMGVGRIRGIKRPCLAMPMPGLDGHSTVFCDLGANADVRPEMIVQFAQMGAAYAQIALGVRNARVGLLSNGEEDTKGSEMALAFHQALKEADCGFVGNAEGTDILLGNFDVIVSDGFTGNIALKTLEGTAKFILKSLKAAIEHSIRGKVGALLLKPVLKDVQVMLSGDDYGGAILLGLKAPVLIGHGATSAQAVAAGTLACAAAVRGQLTEKVASTFAE